MVMNSFDLSLHIHFLLDFLAQIKSNILYSFEIIFQLDLVCEDHHWINHRLTQVDISNLEVSWSSLYMKFSTVFTFYFITVSQTLERFNLGNKSFIFYAYIILIKTVKKDLRVTVGIRMKTYCVYEILAPSVLFSSHVSSLAVLFLC